MSTQKKNQNNRAQNLPNPNDLFPYDLFDSLNATSKLGEQF